MPHQGYHHLYTHPSPYYSTPLSSQFASPYLGYPGYNMSPHLMSPHPEHNPYQGSAHPALGFPRGMGLAFHPGPSVPGPVPGPIPGPGSVSSTEIQLRRVLHDIRGTVQSLGQKRDNTPEQRGPSVSQSLADFQQKRRSLTLFRSQMIDLELSIIRQQAMVYKHLSPADRLEVEQLQSLRSAVRDELLELEQQLEDRLMELTHHTPRKGLHRQDSVDSLSAASALQAMEPVSDLLREQLLLQSELSYEVHTPSTEPSTRASSPCRAEGGVYRASINITPAAPPRPNAHTVEAEEEGRDCGEGGEAVPEERGAAGEVRKENLQELIREIRESVAQEVRQEIYNELMAAVSSRRPPLPAEHHPL